MTIPKTWLIAIVLALASSAWLGVHLYGNQRARMALWQEKYASADSTAKALASRTAKKDTVWRVDSTAYRTASAKYRHLRDSVLKVSTSVPDSRTPNDTVPLIANPVIKACDAALGAADSAVSSCAARDAAKDSLLAAQNQKIQLLLHKPGAPRFPSCVVGPSFGTAGKPEVSVTCGIRIH